jgi:uncharacterized protein YceK
MRFYTDHNASGFGRRDQSSDSLPPWAALPLRILDLDFVAVLDNR